MNEHKNIPHLNDYVIYPLHNADEIKNSLKEGKCINCGNECNYVGKKNREDHSKCFCCECYSKTDHKKENNPSFSKYNYCGVCLDRIKAKEKFYPDKLDFENPSEKEKEIDKSLFSDMLESFDIIFEDLHSDMECLLLDYMEILTKIRMLIEKSSYLDLLLNKLANRLNIPENTLSSYQDKIINELNQSGIQLSE